MPEGSKQVPEVLKKLVFLVARLFYEPRCVIILDIMTHVDSIKDEDLSAMIKIPTKELHKICGKLLEDKFIQMFTRQESKKADQRPVPKTYYVIDYRKIVDVVKWKLYQVKLKVNEKVLKAKESSGYKCPYCEKKYNVFDAIKFVDHDTGLFKCFDDDTELVVEVPEENNETEGLNALFNEQTRPIIELLKQTDDIQLEDVNLTSIKKSIEAKQNAQKSDINSQLDISKDTGSNETKITVVILEDEQKTKEAQEAENERKRLQNAMPVWHVKSTVRPLHMRYARVPDKKSKDFKPTDNSISLQLLKNGVEYYNEPIFNEKDLENAQKDQKKRAKFYEKFYTMLNDEIETKKGIKRSHEQAENPSNNEASNREDYTQGSAIGSTA